MDNIVIGIFMFSEHEARIIKTILSLNKENFTKNFVIKKIELEHQIDNVNIIFLNGKLEEGLLFYKKERANYKAPFVVFSNTDSVVKKLQDEDFMVKLPIKSEEVLDICTTFDRLNVSSTKPKQQEQVKIEKPTEATAMDRKTTGASNEEKKGFLGKLFGGFKKKSSADSDSLLTLNTASMSDYSGNGYLVKEEMNEELQKFLETIKTLFLTNGSNKVCQFDFISDNFSSKLYLNKKMDLVCCAKPEEIALPFKHGDDAKVKLSFISEEEFLNLPENQKIRIFDFIEHFVNQFNGSFILNLNMKGFSLKTNPNTIKMKEEFVNNQTVWRVVSLLENQSWDIFSLQVFSKIEFHSLLKIMNLLYTLDMLKITDLDKEVYPPEQGLNLNF